MNPTPFERLSEDQQNKIIAYRNAMILTTKHGATEMNMQNNTTPFGLLSDEQQEKIKSADNIEWFNGTEWKLHTFRAFYNTGTYRIKPDTPDSIDWSHVEPKFKFMARDKDDKLWLYEKKPQCRLSDWYLDNGHAIRALGFASYRRGTCYWKNSLVERPK